MFLLWVVVVLTNMVNLVKTGNTFMVTGFIKTTQLVLQTARKFALVKILIAQQKKLEPKKEVKFYSTI